MKKTIEKQEKEIRRLNDMLESLGGPEFEDGPEFSGWSQRSINGDGVINDNQKES